MFQKLQTFFVVLGAASLTVAAPQATGTPTPTPQPLAPWGGATVNAFPDTACTVQNSTFFTGVSATTGCFNFFPAPDTGGLQISWPSTADFTQATFFKGFNCINDDPTDPDSEGDQQGTVTINGQASPVACTNPSIPPMPNENPVGNGTIKSITQIVDSLSNASLDPKTEVVIAPPSLFLLLTREHLRKGIEVAAQNVFDKPNGAFTGEISAEQLMDSGIGWALAGHSERRVILGEDNSFVSCKTKAALDAGLGVILCVGETLEQREANRTIEVVTTQLKAVSERIKDWSKIVIAYEPVWAIGTGKVASTEQAQEVHAAIREWLTSIVSKEASDATRIIYGGSVSDKNCKELAKQKDIDGFLVGGASLKPAFFDIINSHL
ncbi:triosephosphate isomerase [Toensbergia leucococca]|nr:triosephosphate isomerase [Toensbergia leucococca]